MDDSLVEKIARALCLTDGFDPDSTDSGVLIKGREGARPNWEAFEVPARACLSAIEAEGYVVVPREPTAEMVDAMAPGELGRHWRRELYRAALAAAPKQG